MGFIEELPPLDERIMNDFAEEMLFFIAHQQEKMTPVNTERLNNRFSGHGDNFYTTKNGLLNAGYIDGKLGVNVTGHITLTDKGWAVVGDKPMWLA